MDDRLSNRLRVRRAELRVTQDQLARQLSNQTKRYWSQNRIHRIENGLAEPTPDERAAIAKALETTVDELFPAAPQPVEAAR